MSSVGKNIPHDSAIGHVSGESVYIDDMAPLRGELIVDFLWSPVAHGRIRGIEFGDAARSRICSRIAICTTTSLARSFRTNFSWPYGIDDRNITPYGQVISFNTKFLNQANALVNLYLDGSVQVSTGATEMGQGVNTKIRQIVADEFGIDADRVLLMPTSTEKNNNTSATAASSGADLNGSAAADACRKIRARMAGVRGVLRARRLRRGISRRDRFRKR